MEKHQHQHLLADPKNVQQTQINFVDMPNAVQSEIAVVNTVNLKLLTIFCYYFG
jgi:hypothetical protein